jgi:hypothetical protein
MEVEVKHLQSQTTGLVDFSILRDKAKENIKERWEKWGIWNENWFDVPGSRWEHEELLETCHEIDTTEAASRPYYQFCFQLEYERQKMLRSGWDVASPNINTMAAKKVRCSWEARRIWNQEWQGIPGLTWKHESYLNVWTENTRREGFKPPWKDTTQAMPPKRTQLGKDINSGEGVTQHKPEIHSTGPNRVLSSLTPLPLRPHEPRSAGLLPELNFKTPTPLSTRSAVATQIPQGPPLQSAKTPTGFPKRRGKLGHLWKKLRGRMGGIS